MVDGSFLPGDQVLGNSLLRSYHMRAVEYSGLTLNYSGLCDATGLISLMRRRRFGLMLEYNSERGLMLVENKASPAAQELLPDSIPIDLLLPDFPVLRQMFSSNE